MQWLGGITDSMDMSLSNFQDLHHQAPPGGPSSTPLSPAWMKNILLLNPRASQVVLVVKKPSANVGVPEVTGSSPGNPGFPAATRESP